MPPSAQLCPSVTSLSAYLARDPLRCLSRLRSLLRPLFAFDFLLFPLTIRLGLTRVLHSPRVPLPPAPLALSGPHCLSPAFSQLAPFLRSSSSLRSRIKSIFSDSLGLGFDLRLDSLRRITFAFSTVGSLLGTRPGTGGYDGLPFRNQFLPPVLRGDRLRALLG